MLDTVGTIIPSTASTHADDRERVVSLAFPISSDHTPRA